jgi:hypothetical protein
MSNYPAPARTVPATSDNFRRIVKSTGADVKDALQKGLEPAIRTPFYLFYNMESFNIETFDGRSNMLKKVMDHFEKEVNSNGVVGR